MRDKSKTERKVEKLCRRNDATNNIGDALVLVNKEHLAMPQISEKPN